MTDERRRVILDHPSTDGGGRTGCVVLGAVLGIIAGIMFALYGLPPILNTLYGEKVVPPGETASIAGRQFHIASFSVGTDSYCQSQPACPAATVQVHISVRADTGWEPLAKNFSLEFESIDTWLEALAPVPGKRETALTWGSEENRTVVLRFPLPLGATPEETVPVALHIARPRIRLEFDGTLRR